MSTVKTLHILYTSTSGHTEYVIERVGKFLLSKNVEISLERAENATAEDFQKGDVLLMASGTWNTGGVEGRLNPYMHTLLRDKTDDVNLSGKTVAVIGLGDERYRYLCSAADRLKGFVEEKGGSVFEPVFRVINEPYGQEEMIDEWSRGLFNFLSDIA